MSSNANSSISETGRGFLGYKLLNWLEEEKGWTERYPDGRTEVNKTVTPKSIKKPP